MRKSNFLSSVFLIFICLVLYSCKTKQTVPLAEERFCTELYLDSTETKAFEIKGVAPHESLWFHSIEFPLSITVKFLNGSPFQINKVRQYAKQWEGASAKHPEGGNKIRIKFIPYDGTTSGNITDIRIIFRPGGSSSYIGSDAKKVNADSATMFFGWINEGEPEESIRQVVLHEFGHVLGLVHEHQSPLANIPWDKEKVYEYYRTTQNPPWDRAKVDANIFSRYSASSTNYSAYDIHSIMHYAIPSSLTVDGFSTPWNSELSPTDKGFIKKIYRYEPCIVNETCCFDQRGRRIPCP